MSTAQLVSILVLASCSFVAGVMFCLGLVLVVSGRPFLPPWGKAYSKGETRSIGTIFSVWGPVLALQGLFIALRFLAPDSSLVSVVFSSMALACALAAVVCASLLLILLSRRAGIWPHGNQ